MTVADERTHDAGCWREHHDCAIARVEQLDRQLARELVTRGYERRVMSCGHVMYWPFGAELDGEICHRCAVHRAAAMRARVDRPTEGRWAGYTFVNVQAGPNYHPVRGNGARGMLAQDRPGPQGGHASLRAGAGPLRLLRAGADQPRVARSWHRPHLRG
jgi:hypothetical protein